MSSSSFGVENVQKKNILPGYEFKVTSQLLGTLSLTFESK